ncbi:MAG: hypothetical protein SGILL_006667 [Bacillariaceae sp.]
MAEEKDSNGAVVPAERPFRMVGGMKVDAQDYENVCSLIQLVYDDLEGRFSKDADGNPLPVDEVFQKFVKSRECCLHQRSVVLHVSWGMLQLNTYSAQKGKQYPDRLSNLSVSWNEVSASLPTGIIERLDWLKKLHFLGLEALTELPEGLEKMESLEALMVSYCSSLTHLPQRLPPNLVELRIQNNAIESLPDSLGQLSSLQRFDADFARLAGIPISFQNLTNLKELDTGTDSFAFAVPASIISQLTVLRTSTHNLRNFSTNPRCLKKMFLRTKILEEADANNMFDDINRSQRWNSVEALDWEIEFECSLDVTYDISRILRSFPQLREFRFRTREEDIDARSFRFSLTELSHLQSVEILHLWSVTLQWNGEEAHEHVRLPCLKELFINGCETDWVALSHLSLPKVEELSIRDCELNDAQFEQLCTTWIANLPSITSLRLYGNVITAISQSAVQALARLKLRFILLYCNPVLNRVDHPYFEMRNREKLSEEEIEQNLLPLLTACQFLGGGLEYVMSEKINHAMFMNEARTKVFDGQSIPVALWPLALKNGNKAFKHQNTCSEYYSTYENERSMQEHDAIYTLLRKRAALEIFGGGVSRKRKFET